MRLFYFDHLAQSIQLRTSLYLEARRAKNQGNTLPKGWTRKVWKKPHDHEEYLWLLRFVPNFEKITLIDIGGNSGYWAEEFLHYYPAAKVYAFEPVKAMFNQYVQRFSSNKNIRVFNTALGETNQEQIINIADGYGLTSFHTYDGGLTDRNKHFKREEKVTVSKLNDFHSMIDFNKTIIKVDVQGFEQQVIQGGIDVFSKADLVIAECSFINEFKLQLPSFGEVTHLLRQVDLHPIRFGVFDRKVSPIAYERNVLFVKSEYFPKIWGYADVYNLNGL